jgi:hypothetical protein
MVSKCKVIRNIITRTLYLYLTKTLLIVCNSFFNTKCVKLPFKATFYLSRRVVSFSKKTFSANPTSSKHSVTLKVKERISN